MRLISHSDLSLPPLSNLSIQQQQQHQQFNQEPHTYNTRLTKAPLVPAPQPSYSSQHQQAPQQLHSENDHPQPIPAPVPTRTVPVANMTANGGHMVNTWNPDMGIKFGAGGAQGNAMAAEGRSPGWAGGQGQPNQTWDPSKGFKFG